MHVFARLNGLQGHRRVQEGRGGDIDDINFGSFEHIGVIGIDFLNPILLGKMQRPRLIHIADGYNFSPRMRLIALEMRSRGQSQPDHTDAQRFHFYSPISWRLA